MASNAPMTRYRNEFIAEFEQHQSMLRMTVTTEHMMDGNVATFLVAGSNDATPVTRGLDGRIPARDDSLTQNSCTLVEYHDKPVRTHFNVFESQGDARRISMESSIGVMNRKIDSDILGSNGLGAATNGDTTAQTADLNWFMGHLTELGENDVPIDQPEKMFAIVTPKAWGLLSQIKEFSSGEYVELKVFNGPPRKVWRVFGVNIIMSTRISGVGTSSASCYMFHRDAIGHAIANGHPSISGGYNEEDAYYWTLCSGYFGSKMLQDSGIRKMLHNDTSY